MNHAFVTEVATLKPGRYVGAVCSIANGAIACAGPLATVGDVCAVETEPGAAPVLAEVAAVANDRVLLTLLDPQARVRPHARVVLQPAKAKCPVGQGFAGRLVDAAGAPLDGGPEVRVESYADLNGAVLSPLQRCDGAEALATGVRAIDGLTPLARGQRVGVFSASGVGKTTLMRQLLANIACDQTILCLVGERGREVELLWREIKARRDQDRFTIVSATSDVSAPLRARAVSQALSLAEHWRAQGRHVVLMIDSVTRYAMALREIGLAAGAAPTARGYTANVFSALPRVVERCGGARNGGAITAIMTVLSENDEVDDPIVETMKALLDGHIVLSRRIAEQGRFPAIDPLRSVSRLAPEIMTSAHARAARALIARISRYEDARILIESGLYKKGADPELDDAVAAHPSIDAFLRQTEGVANAFARTLQEMHRIEAAHGR